MSADLLDLNRVVHGGYCIGCGLCAYLAPQPVANELDQYGMFRPDLPSSTMAVPGAWRAAAVTCPFTNHGPNEDDISRQYFGDLPHDINLGRVGDLYVGHVSDESLRAGATSGGIITWILCRLLEQHHVDYVVHVRPASHDSSLLFTYGISTSSSQVRSAAKSSYYPVELSRIMQEIERRKGTCAVVGLPCFLKGLRRLNSVRPDIGAKIAFHVGLVCGHLKSAAFASCLACQVGVAPDRLTAADFRVKVPDRSADDYGFAAYHGSECRVGRVRELIGGNWGLNLFRYPACDYCDDVFAECADVTVGDAWLQHYTSDPGGNSVVVVRHAGLRTLLMQGIAEGELLLDPASADAITKSQAGGLADRREGLRYRLHLKMLDSTWTPSKRFGPRNDHLNERRRAIFRSRMRLALESHVAWHKAMASKDTSGFFRQINFYSALHHSLYQRAPRRWLSNLRARLRRWCSLFR